MTLYEEALQKGYYLSRELERAVKNSTCPKGYTLLPVGYVRTGEEMLFWHDVKYGGFHVPLTSVKGTRVPTDGALNFEVNR